MLDWLVFVLIFRREELMQKITIKADNNIFDDSGDLED